MFCRSWFLLGLLLGCHHLLPVCLLRSHPHFHFIHRHKMVKTYPDFQFPKFLVTVAQLCLTLCDAIDYSMPGFPSSSPGACSNSCPLSRWCHPTISSSVVSSSCLQSSPASGSFLMNQLFTSGGHSIGASAAASVLPVNIQDWFI